MHWAARQFAAAARPPAPDLLADESTGLRDIVAFLLTPPYSGLFLSRDDIGRLGRARNLPRGFGDRSQILLNLLRAAGSYDGVGGLLNDLAGLARQWVTGYRQMAAPGDALQPAMQGWQSAAEATAAMLDQMAEQAERLTAMDNDSEHKVE